MSGVASVEPLSATITSHDRFVSCWARASRGSVLLFCDVDDEVMPGGVDGAWNALRQFDLVGGPNHELREPRDPQGPVCLLYTYPSPRDGLLSRMPSPA